MKTGLDSGCGELDLELVNILAGLGSDEVGGSAGGDNVGRDLFRRLPATQMPKPHGRGVVRGRHGRRYEDDVEGVTRTTWTWFCRSSYCRHGGVLQVRVVPAVDVVERFWNSVAGDAFSFCGSY